MVVYLHKGMLYYTEKNKLHSATWLNIIDMTLSKRNQTRYRRVTFMSAVDREGPRWSLLGNVLQCGYHVGVYICKNFTEIDP